MICLCDYPPGLFVVQTGACARGRAGRYAYLTGRRVSGEQLSPVTGQLVDQASRAEHTRVPVLGGDGDHRGS